MFSEMIVMHDAGVRLPLLLQRIPLRGIFARNRIIVSPMCQYESRNGGPTDWHLVNLGNTRLAAQESYSQKRPQWRSAVARPMNVLGSIRTIMSPLTE